VHILSCLICLVWSLSFANLVKIISQFLLFNSAHHIQSMVHVVCHLTVYVLAASA
jgi:hypothetical protein